MASVWNAIQATIGATLLASESVQNTVLVNGLLA